MSQLYTFRQTHPIITFEDDFNTGTLNASNWLVSTGSAPGEGLFDATYVDLSLGCLRMKLTQNTVTSVSSEIQSANTFGYGLYEWTMRMGSDATTLAGAGNSHTGGVSAGFNFINNSQTEIDFEVEGQSPSRLELSSWQTVSNAQHASRFFEQLSNGIHLYSFLWVPGSIEYYIDNLHMLTFTGVVPTTPAYALLNHWGTNSVNFGGVRSPGVTRYLYCTRFAFTAN